MTKINKKLSKKKKEKGGRSVEFHLLPRKRVPLKKKGVSKEKI